MKKFWTIFKHEYIRHVLRKRFLFALLSLPIWLLVMVVITAASVLLQLNRTPIGYIDLSGVLANGGRPTRINSEPDMFDVEFLPFESESEARAALDGKLIQAYIVLPEDYRQTLQARMVYNEAPDGVTINQFRNMLRVAVLQDQPREVARRVLASPQLSIQAADDAIPQQRNDWFRIIAPFTAALFLLISVFTSAGYLLQAVVEEKENRTMEILATSVSPWQIMIGKIAALICVGWTQVFIWSAFPLLLIVLVQLNTPFLQNVQIDWSLIGLIVVTAVPTFVLISSLMATIGATITEAREGQQVMTLITLPVMAPLMLLSVIIANPNGLIATIMSFFPLTAGLTLLMRVGYGTVPSWQMALSISIQLLSAVGALWLAGRVFRLGMLRYGRRMGWKDVFRAALPQQVPPTRKEAA
jgi:ABC-2 type transport system permease protein